MSNRRNDQTDAAPDVPERIGPYEVRGSLGKGGMGEVYRGYDDRLARPVALKRVLTTEADSTKFRRRLRREARTVAQLNHSSIVQVYDWVETQEFDWLVMELVDGKPLSDLAQEGRLPMDRVVDIAIGIADGLAAAHEAGIIHRDLKLGNVMVSKSGVKILDFGIAKPTRPGDIGQTEITREGAVVGTASSMSPEQGQGLPIDHRSDLFSFGTLLYELLTGVSPFRGHDMLQTILRIYSVEQAPVVELNADVPQRLSHLIDHLLAKEPENRPPDAESVAEELRAIATELRGDSQTGLRRPLFTTASLEATLAGGAPTPMPTSQESSDVRAPTGPPQHPAPRTDPQSASLHTGSPQTGSPHTGSPQTGSPQTGGPQTGALGPHAPGTGIPHATGTGADSQTFYGPAPTAFRLWIGILATLLVAAVAWGIYRGQAGEPSMTTDQATANPDTEEATELRADRIVVLPFDNRTGKKEFDSLGLVISDWLTQGLSLSRQLEIVPTDLTVRTARYASSQAENEGEPIDLQLVADDTKARTLVTGAFYLRRGELIVRARLTDAAEGKVITGLEQLTTPADDPIGVLEELEQSVRASVATYLDPQLTTYGNLFNSPPTYDAYEAYVRGMESFLHLDFPAAIESFETAGNLAPTFAMPRLMAATAHINLGQFDEVTPIIEHLHQERDDLAPVDRYWLDWLRAERDGEHVKAAQIAGQVASLAPLSGWPQTRGVASLRANMPHQALEALRPLDPEHGYLRGWVPHFEYLTLAYHLTGDHEGEFAAARHGRDLYPDSMLLLSDEARANVALGNTSQAIVLLKTSQGLPQQHLHTPGLVMTLIAAELTVHGHPEAARKVNEELVTWYESRDEEQLPASEGQLKALALLNLDRADQALAISRRLRDENPESVEYIGFLGVAAAAAGDRQTSDEQLAALRTLDQPYLFGRDSYWRAAIHAWSGSEDEAVDHYQKAVFEGHPFAWPRLHPHFDPIWHPLRDNPDFADAIRPRG